MSLPHPTGIPFVVHVPFGDEFPEEHRDTVLRNGAGTANRGWREASGFHKLEAVDGGLAHGAAARKPPRPDLGW